MQETINYYMETDKLIVAIELGSSKISGVAGQKLFDGTLKVMAYASTPSASCIRHGAVYNVDRTANAIAEVISRLESMLSAKIEKVFIGYNSKSLKSVITEVDRQFDEETVVSQQIVDDMFEECERMGHQGYANLFQESLEYVVDDMRGTEQDPMGIACSKLKGRYLNILLKQQIAEYMAHCFNMAQVTLEDGYVTPMVQAEAALTEDERQQGCAFVDYGADTTTVSVYKGGQLRWLRVIPLGSSLITRDLAQVLKIEMEQAENLKCAYGLCSYVEGQDLNETVPVQGKKILLKDIGEIIEARNEEIVRNVSAQIHASGLYDMLYAGIVLTGGGSKLRQLDKVFVKVMPELKTPRFVSAPICGVTWNEPMWRKDDGSQLALLAVMAKGDSNCCQFKPMDALETMEPAQEQNLMQGSLFDDEGNSAQEKKDQEEARRREEAARQAAEEEKTKAEEPKEPTGGKKKVNFLKKFLGSIMDKGEEFFESEAEQESENNKTTEQ